MFENTSNAQCMIANFYGFTTHAYAFDLVQNMHIGQCGRVEWGVKGSVWSRK